jgi:tetratricopeptide (TPR) repeat protein
MRRRHLCSGYLSGMVGAARLEYGEPAAESGELIRRQLGNSFGDFFDLALTPSFARGWFLSGALRLWAGQHDLAIDHAKVALRLSPRERSGTPHSLIGEAHFYKHEFDEAVAQLLFSIHNHPGFPHSFQVLAACYGQMGQIDEARAIVARLRAITPLILPSVAHLRRPEDRELFFSGMRLDSSAGFASSAATIRGSFRRARETHRVRTGIVPT